MIKLYIILNTLIVLVLNQICPEDEYSFKNECIPKSCLQYIEKLTSKKKPSGKRFLQLEMNGKVIKYQEHYRIEIEFNDELIGVFNRDNNLSCITDQLYRHEMNYVLLIEFHFTIRYKYTEKFILIYFFDNWIIHDIKDDTIELLAEFAIRFYCTTIISSYVSNKRKWSFLIDELNNKLYLDKQSEKSIYNGFYTMNYFVKNYVILQYMFDFQIVLDNTQNLIDVHFNDQLLDDQVSCNFFGTCVQKIYTEITFCNDKDCQEMATEPNITQNNPLYLMSEIKEEGFQDWYCENKRIKFQINYQLVKRFKPVFEQHLPGKTIFKLIVPFIADKGSLYISSKLTKNSYWRRVLEKEIGTTLAISIYQDAPCIKMNPEGQCPNQEQIEKMNQLDCGNVDILYCDGIDIFNAMMLILILMII